MRALNLSLPTRVKKILDLDLLLEGDHVFLGVLYIFLGEPGALDRASTALKNTWVLKAII